jgi:hypothetical protein
MESMSVTHLRKWDATPIEIALDVEIPPLSDPSRVAFSGPAEPRICLVAGFALTSQLKHVISAVDRTVPERPPSGLRITPWTSRSAKILGTIAVAPMPVLLRLQSKLVRSIEPGLARRQSVVALTANRDLDEAGVNFVLNFIPDKVLPTFEPQEAMSDFDFLEIEAVGLTVYRLGPRGAPESILAHWSYPHDRNRSHPLRGRP